MPTVSLALVAALLFALGNVLQQRVAMEFPDRLAHSPLFLVRLLRRPEWIAGMAIILAGFAFHAAALSDGQIVVVQPILSLTLVLSLPIRVRLTAQRIGPRDVACRCSSPSRSERSSCSVTRPRESTTRRTRRGCSRGRR
jgi:hypothetical protein